jgi:hypothetical protein
MLSLFKSRRRIRLLANEKKLQHYLDVVKTLPAEELASSLDMATEIKSSCLKFEEAHTDYWNAFNKPILVTEKAAERIQASWVDRMMAMHNAEPSQAQLYASGINIWSHSLLAAAYPELRQQGLALWKEFQRGFDLCKRFDPQQDVPEVI